MDVYLELNLSAKRRVKAQISVSRNKRKGEISLSRMLPGMLFRLYLQPYKYWMRLVLFCRCSSHCSWQLLLFCTLLLAYFYYYWQMYLH